MKTKFIGLEGYNEIEGLNEPKKRRSTGKELNTAQKTVRFVKRASRMIFKSVKRKRTAARRSVLDRQYAMNRQNPHGPAPAFRAAAVPGDASKSSRARSTAAVKSTGY